MKCTPHITKYCKNPEYDPMTVPCATQIKIVDANLTASIAVGQSNPPYHFVVDILGTANQLLDDTVQIPGQPADTLVIAVESGNIRDGQMGELQYNGLVALVAFYMRKCSLTAANVIGGPKVTAVKCTPRLVADIALAAASCVEDVPPPPTSGLTCDDLAACPAVVAINTQITTINNTLASVTDCNGAPVDLATQPIATCADLDAVLGSLLKCDGSAIDPATDRLVTCADLIPVTDDQVLTGSTGLVTIVATPAAPTGLDGQVNYLLSATVDIPAILSALVKCDDTAFDVAVDKIATCAQLPSFIDCAGNPVAPQGGEPVWYIVYKGDEPTWMGVAPAGSVVLGLVSNPALSIQDWVYAAICAPTQPAPVDGWEWSTVASPINGYNGGNTYGPLTLVSNGNAVPTCAAGAGAPVYQVATCDDLAAIDVCALLAARPAGADVLVSPIPTGVRFLGDDCEFHSLADLPAPVYTRCDGAALSPADLVVTVGNIDPAGAVLPARVLVDTGACPTYLRAPGCSDTLPSIPVVFGADANGNMAFGRPWRAKLLVISQTDASSSHTNGNDVRVYRGGAAGTINLTEPTDCRKNDIYIKNRSGFPLTINAQAGATIDGQPSIVLDPTVTAGYPFGNNGGESVHLLWDAAAGEWLVL